MKIPMNRPAMAFAFAPLALATDHAQAQAELHTFCLNGCPVDAPGIDDIVVREFYTLASNDLT